METSKPRILVVDDERDMVAFLEDLLHKAGFDADGACPTANRCTRRSPGAPKH